MLYGPYGYLIGPKGLGEDELSLHADPADSPDMHSFPLYALVDIVAAVQAAPVDEAGKQVLAERGNPTPQSLHAETVEAAQRLKHNLQDCDFLEDLTQTEQDALVIARAYLSLSSPLQEGG